MAGRSSTRNTLTKKRASPNSTSLSTRRRWNFETTYPTGGGFGLVFDDAGRSFVTHNINHMQMRILPRRILDEVPGGSPLRGTQNISVHGENTRIYPAHEAQTRPNHPEQAGYFSSSGGMGYLNHSGWPASMANSLFVCDAASGIVHREVLSPDGPLLKCQRPPDEQTSEFLAGRDPAFRPVGVELGPDGALYILDMQRDVIEHPDYIPPRMKAKVDLRAGSDRGRIWRITPKAGLPKPDKLPAFATVGEKVDLLGSPNQWTRLTSQRLLIEHPDGKALPLLHNPVAGRAAYKAHAPYQAYPIHHLFTLSLLGQLTSADIIAAVTHSAPEVRAAAIRCACATSPDIREAARPSLTPLQEDPSPSVRGNILLFARVLSLTGLEDIALRSLERDGANPWMRASALRLLGRESTRAIELVKKHTRTEPEAIHDIARALAKPDSITELLYLAASISDAAFTAAADGILASPSALAAPEHVSLSSSLMDLKRPLLLDGVLRLRKAGFRIFQHGYHKSKLIEAPSDIELPWIMRYSTSAERPPAARVPWVRLLRHYPFEKTAAAIFSALRATEPGELHQAALECLRARTEPEVAARIVKEWPLIAPSLRPSLAALMVDRKEFRSALADALVSGAIKPGEITLDLEQRRELLRHSGDGIKNKVAKFLTDDEYSNRAALVDQWLAKLPATGDPVNGKAAFQKQCFQCHRAGGLGHEVGPDLAAQSHRSAEDLLTHILDPDAAINPNYAAFLAETADGQKHTGILVSSSGANIVLLQAMGLKTEIPRTSLKSLQSTGHSLMPAGMEAVYTPQEMRDLIAFLQQRTP